MQIYSNTVHLYNIYICIYIHLISIWHMGRYGMYNCVMMYHFNGFSFMKKHWNPSGSLPRNQLGSCGAVLITLRPWKSDIQNIGSIVTWIIFKYVESLKSEGNVWDAFGSICPMQPQRAFATCFSHYVYSVTKGWVHGFGHLQTFLCVKEYLIKALKFHAISIWTKPMRMAGMHLLHVPWSDSKETEALLRFDECWVTGMCF